MNKTINRWFQFVVCYIVFRCFCRGEINLVPRNVPWENEQWTLDCSLDRIENTVSIINPKAETVGNCDPASGGRPSACHPADGYTFVINVNIVSMTRKIFNNETGAWTCQHSEDSAKYNLQSPLPRRHYATSFTSYEIHWMSATPGSELTTDTVHTFSVHCGCMSSRLKFVWMIVSGTSLQPIVSYEDTSNTISTNFTCTTDSAYKSIVYTNMSILQTVPPTGSKLKVTVYVDGYYNITAVDFTYNVTFSHSKSPGNDVGLRNKNLWNCFFLVFILGILF
ncbi:uncharacterized protein LOC134720861 isoform X2 [Mytilus trossulus]|uniref:uncharacterized protein LOC134720861 isoform X2 n=1 Tax=Mytilus trossulus TaxID=6551 RepID=UPI003005448E